ncbi:MAG: ECF-type sigma factor [Gemmatimonadota bacterium]
MTEQSDVTGLLLAAADGDGSALERLVPIVYTELRRIAHRRLGGERVDHTLGTTDLVHEAYLKLVNLDRLNWRNRAQFMAIVSRLMRQILVDYARRRRAGRRGGGRPKVELGAVAEYLAAASAAPSEELLTLHQALERLEEINDRHARIVECRFFGGMSIEETAEAMSLSPATVKRDWVMARAWLNRELSA